MNAYDFDGTIHRGDSSIRFYFFCLARRPYIALLWPFQAVGALLYALKIIDKTAMKQVLLFYFRLLDAEKLSAKFWNKFGTKNIYPWYFENKKEDDVLVSASPEFFLKPICETLGIKTLIATKADPKTGRIDGFNCSNEHKVERFKDMFGELRPDSYYYDSKNDLPIAAYAKSSYKIVKGKVVRTS